MSTEFIEQFKDSLILFQHDAKSMLDSSYWPASWLVEGDQKRAQIDEMQRKGYAPMYTVNAFNTEPGALSDARVKFRENRGDNVKEPVTPRFKENLKAIQACFLDLDLRKEGTVDGSIDDKKKKVFAALDALEVPPTIIVMTKNGLQCLWRVEDNGNMNPSAEYIQKYTDVERGIIEWSKTLGGYGDQVKDVTRIFRLPGYNHLKNPAEPYRVEHWFTSNPQVYKLAELHSFFESYIPVKQPIQKADFHPIHFGEKPSFDLAESINTSVDIRDAVSRAFAAVGAQFEVHHDNYRWIIDGRLTGNFFSKQNVNIACTSSGTEPYSGQPFAVIINIFKAYGRTTKDALMFMNETWGKVLLKHEIQVQAETEKQQIIEAIPTDVSCIATDVHSFIEDVMSRRHGDYFSWGLDEVDMAGGLLTLGRMAIIGGQHGSGKTTYITEIARVNSKNKKSMLIPLEMGADYTLMMLATNRFNEKKGATVDPMSYGEVEEGYLYERSKSDQDLFIRCVQEIYTEFPKLYIRTPQTMEFNELKAFIEKWHVDEKIDFFIVDHIHQLTTHGKDNESETQFFSSVAKELKELALKLNIALLCVVQLTKAANMKGAEVDFSSFKGTSEFTSNAHRVVVIKRPSPEPVAGYRIKEGLKSELGRKPSQDELFLRAATVEEEFAQKTRNIRELNFLKTRGRDGGVITVELKDGQFYFKNYGAYRAV